MHSSSAWSLLGKNK